MGVVLNGTAAGRREGRLRHLQARESEGRYIE